MNTVRLPQVDTVQGGIGINSGGKAGLGKAGEVPRVPCHRTAPACRNGGDVGCAGTHGLQAAGCCDRPAATYEGLELHCQHGRARPAAPQHYEAVIGVGNRGKGRVRLCPPLADMD